MSGDARLAPRPARAHWVTHGTLAWPGPFPEGGVYRLHHSAEGGFQLAPAGVQGGESVVLELGRNGLPGDVLAGRPHLRTYGALRLPVGALGRAENWLRGQLAVSLTDADGRLLYATGVQIAGVLDDLFVYGGPLGVTWRDGVPELHLWAPTARSVTLLLFEGPRTAEPSRALALARTGGVWSARGEPSWRGLYYQYEVEVFTPATGAVERHRVTDPYARSLSANGERAQIVDLDEAELAPPNWHAWRKPAFSHPADAVVYELHVRDFSAHDPEVPDTLRGTYEAFGLDSHGTRHLRDLAAAGVTHVQLLPIYDFASVDEQRSNWQSPADLAGRAPDSQAPQAALDEVRARDPYNWGYDPVHWGVPEGSYAVEPDGARRVLEFRRMVQALWRLGLRLVVDVVYNHTYACDADRFAVLDRIVPGYYHRLDDDGRVTNSSCCPNTASEHRMMERLMLDDLEHWARDYKVDGFRFDIMGHHMRRNLVAARERLRALDLDRDGVDGGSLLLHGEGWDFGEVAGGARGLNATQIHLAGTGIGSFNDRLRDAARGGGPFDDPREQGFATGLFVDANGFNRAGEAEAARLAAYTERVRLSLAGALADYPLPGPAGERRAGDLDFGGYTADPAEAIQFVSCHDGLVLWDKALVAAPPAADLDDLVRRHHLALALVALSQGVPFFHAGDEMLRSKSFDADSYDSGDWFNRLDFTLSTNNFGVGLPPAWKNHAHWPLYAPLLRRSDWAPSPDHLRRSLAIFREWLAIRRSSPLFRLRRAAEVCARVRFPRAAGVEEPGVITMLLRDDLPDERPIDPEHRRLVCVFNAAPEPREVGHAEWRGALFALHPAQASGADPLVRAALFDPARGVFAVPARTAAVFVELRTNPI